MNRFKIQKTEALVIFICLFISFCCIHAVAFRSREHAKKIVCVENLLLNTQAVLGYAEDHDGNVMFNNYASWAQDFSYFATDELIKYGSNRQAFYCPSKKSWNAFDSRLWQYTQSPPFQGTYQDLVEPADTATRQRNFRAISYIFLINNLSGKPSILGQPPRAWLQDINDISNPTEYEMVIDNTIAASVSGPFHSVLGSTWMMYGLMDKTNHLAKNGKPLGGNIGYVDGHVAWKSFEQIQLRLQLGFYFWW